MADAFIPPSLSLPVAWTVDFTLPLLLKQVHNIQRVHIQDSDRAMLRALKSQRLIYASNHPSTAEPPVAYAVANRMGARFHYMAARGVFDWGYGFVGRFIQSVGAFSVLPGIADRESLRQSRAVLSAPQGKLALFPEGEPTSGENDNLMPFQSGLAQLGFWSLEDARKNEAGADIKVLPAFVKYVYHGTDPALKVELHTSLRRLEQRLKIDPGNRNLLRRFLFLGRMLLERAEQEYRIPAASKTDFDYRVGRLRHAILDQVQDRFRFPGYEPGADAIHKLRFLMAQLEVIEVGLAETARLPQLKREDRAWARRECLKAYAFIAARAGYLIERPTPERFFEWLTRFENFVFQESKSRLRSAHVFFATPISLGDAYNEYAKNKRRTVERVTVELRSAIDHLMQQALALSQPLVRPGDLSEELG
ncbi:MAG: 1-acyl-sn-glycerol-3-phosphate acyltransferase [Leptospirales bacterium]|nr:1-acyl-sn-glycerol-3-phosphate acyltransferase [Leptospirales bacterium]